jgi:hypothetical protein
MLQAKPTDTGVRVGTPGSPSVVVSAEDWTADDRTHDVSHAADTVGGRATAIRLPTGRLGLRRVDETSSQAPPTLSTGATRLPEGSYLLRIAGSVVVYVRFDGSATIDDPGGRPTLSFSESRLVTVGVGDRSDAPPTVTVPRTPSGVAAALSTASTAHHTATADRSFPELRATPPRIAFGDDLSVPDAVADRRRPSTVELRVPPSLEYLVPSASLVSYLGAEVTVCEAGTAPTLVTPERDLALEPNPVFQTDVGRLLRRVFMLDCLVRSAGPNGPGVAEASLLDDLDLDPESLYAASPGARLDAYLDAAFERVSGRLPDWHLSMYVEPSYDRVRTLPHLLENVPSLYLPESEPLGTDERLSRSLDDFYRSEGIGTGGDVSDVTPVRPILGAGRVHGWLADGVPIDVFKSDSRAYDHRDRHADSESLSVVAVLNDRQMEGEYTDAAHIYEHLSPGVDIDVTVERRPTRAELASIFESEQDLVHYIGHCDEAGLRCRDGNLDVDDVDESNVETFFLNGCGSYYEGLKLVRKGSVAGAVTFEKVLDSHATRVGTAFVRLLVNGFSLERALALARRRIIMGKDYAIVGDGTHVLTDSTDSAPAVATVESNDDGTYRLTYDANTPRVAGDIFRPPLSDTAAPRLLGQARRASLSAAELDAFLDRADVPVIYDGDIQWADELRDDLDP